MILKPAVAQGKNVFTQSKAWRVNNREELLARYDQACSVVDPDIVMLQDFIPGSGDCQLSYAAVWGEEGPIASMMAKRLRQYPIDFGYTSTCVETVADAPIRSIAERLLHSIRFTGLVEIEFKYDRRQGCYKLLDVNGRAWNWCGLGQDAGIDFTYLAWLQSQNQPLPHVVSQAGRRWRHLSRDAAAAILEMRAGRLSPLSYVRSFRGPSDFAVFAADDPLPAAIDMPLQVRSLWRRYANRS
jgi:predicted ATP-grasp superfamily ATP-dependent carboligase